MSSGEIQGVSKDLLRGRYGLVPVFTRAHKAKRHTDQKTGKSNAVCGVLGQNGSLFPRLIPSDTDLERGFIWEVGSEMGGEGLCTLHSHHSGHPGPLPQGMSGETAWCVPQVALPDHPVPPLPSTMMKDRSGHMRVFWLIQ